MGNYLSTKYNAQEVDESEPIVMKESYENATSMSEENVEPNPTKDGEKTSKLNPTQDTSTASVGTQDKENFLS